MHEDVPNATKTTNLHLVSKKGKAQSGLVLGLRFLS